MVATILKKVTTKGIEAATSASNISSTSNVNPSTNTSTGTGSSNSAKPFFSDNKPSANINQIDTNTNVNAAAANNSVSGELESIVDGYYGAVSKYASEVYLSTKDTINTASDGMLNITSSLYSPTGRNMKEMGAMPDIPNAGTEFGNHNVDVPKSSDNTNAHTNTSANTITTPRKWLMGMSDPYNSVSGRNLLLPPNHHRKSVMAVRNLLELVDIDHDGGDGDGDDDDGPESFWERKSHMKFIDEGSVSAESDASFQDEDSHTAGVAGVPNVSSYSSGMAGASAGVEFSSSGKPKRFISKAETASRLSEGTVRAMRDMALNEALELHHALRFWTARLERPLLFYMESGPRLWISKDSDYHADVGQKVSQLQAVLARRCSSIGLLQQHLWRAGWSSGVEQWGILGQGEWDAVVGGHGLIDDRQGMLPDFGDHSPPKKGRKGNKRDYYSQSHLFVKNVRGGQIVRNDAALAAWSIDAIRVVRDQLYMAGSGHKPLPKYEHWPREQRHFDRDIDEGKRNSNPNMWDSMVSIDARSVFEDDEDTLDIPLWATYDVRADNDDTHSFTIKESSGGQSEATNDIEEFLPSLRDPMLDTNLPSKLVKKQLGDVAISDLGLMAAEVAEILDNMETCMEQQRRRRLDKLKPPSRILRNWYVAAFGLPIAGYVAYKLMKENRGLKLAKEFYQQAINFCAEHISEPLQSIYRELFTGRVNVADHKAREDVICILQKMIKSWLDEVFPNMPENERIEKATKMDMSLIESTKEYSIKNILEINNIYRLSLIEMQFIKKEMMNALVAIDELMGSNEINMQLAAMTPALILASSIRHVFGKLYYALLKLGKSKEETYASFRHIILDIERLLVMRDNPPSSIPPLATGVNSLRLEQLDQTGSIGNETSRSPDALTSDDLGMLMLLVHDCRVILWQDRRRFSRSELRNISEDLAEIAGERGAVSIQQQLRIISRMCRTYSFLKAEIPFSVDA